VVGISIGVGEVGAVAAVFFVFVAVGVVRDVAVLE